MPASEKCSPEQVADALRQSRGLFAPAARALGCTNQTIQNYRRKYPQVEAAIEDARHGLLDMAESVVLRRVDQGDPYAVMFALQALGQHRGYTKEISDHSWDMIRIYKPRKMTRQRIMRNRSQPTPAM